MKLDGKILLSQLRELGLLGASPAGGRTRLALSDADKEARDLLVRWMRELDLDVRIDRIGNLFGILHDASGEGFSDALMIGSHIDTVINAGALDGCYGVLAGLAVARAFRASGRKPPRPIVVGAFTNEEGVRYHPDMVGSLVHAGGCSLGEALNAIGTDGTRFGDELERIGYAGELEVGTIVPQEYFELHIEQGPVLEAANASIGVVESLQGISWQRIAIQGTANHAGATPIHLRHDAGYAAAEMIARLRKIALMSHSTRVTAGTIAFEPNAINVIPGKAVFTIDLRDPDEESLCAAEERISECLREIAEKEGVAVTAERLVRFKPVRFDPRLVDLIESVVGLAGLPYLRMPSGAGHDAQMMARICPAAMIFVPSRGGISHNPGEHTDDAQLIQGAQILLAAVQECLRSRSADSRPDGASGARRHD